MSIGPKDPKEALMRQILATLRSPIAMMSPSFQNAKRNVTIGDITLDQLLDFARRETLRDS